MLVAGIVVAALVLVWIAWRSVRERYEVVSDETPSPQTQGLSRRGRFRERNATMGYAHLAGWLIKKNSRNPENKIRFAQEYFAAHFAEDAYNLGNELEQALKYSVHIRSAANAVNKNMRPAAERRQLIDFLIDLAFADGDINEREFVALARLGELIGVRMRYLESRILEHRAAAGHAAHTGLDLLSNNLYRRRKALEVLGLNEKASGSDVKKAYRKLAKAYHPDTFVHASEEEREKAAAVFREIQEAYEILTA